MNQTIVNTLKSFKEKESGLSIDDKIILNDIHNQIFRKEFNRDCDNCVNNAFWDLYDIAIEWELKQLIK
jgi:hypothetical protein